MNRLFIGILRIGLGLAVLIGLYGQIIVIPTTAHDMVEQFHPWGPYAVPYAIVAILGVLCVQVALVAVWMLLGLVRRDLIFTARAFRWIDTVTVAAAWRRYWGSGSPAIWPWGTFPLPATADDRHYGWRGHRRLRGGGFHHAHGHHPRPAA